MRAGIRRIQKVRNPQLHVPYSDPMGKHIFFVIGFSSCEYASHCPGCKGVLKIFPLIPKRAESDFCFRTGVKLMIKKVEEANGM